MTTTSGKDFTPREVVSELERYIISQQAAKKSVAIALRNRWRRRQVPEPLRDEIAPKNIIMVGPTGVGKTEIARRIAKLAQAPFVKVEASKFTEVGYVGRDVESMIRDLVEISVKLCRDEAMVEVRERAKQAAEDKLLDKLLPEPEVSSTVGFEVRDDDNVTIDADQTKTREASSSATREKLRELLRAGKLDDKKIDLDVQGSNQMPFMQVFGNQGMEEMALNLQDMFQNIPGMHGKKKRRSTTVAEAREILTEQEAQRLVDTDEIQREALHRAEESGIVFIDEIDKIAGRESKQGPDVSREGVQRDILPIVEGSTVTTKYGMVKTDHVLFIAAGAFHMSKVSDLIPELQGRFPIRVELEALKEEDFCRILREPDNSLVKQYVALMKTEGIDLQFTDDSIEEIAKISAEVNARQENIGARRLHTVMEKILEELSFTAPERTDSEVIIDAKAVRESLDSVLEDQDLSRYIL